MLTTLRIKNLALVSDLTLELQPGCNAVTGETGAGQVHHHRRIEPDAG
jgi:DNA repair protein RecN (Recombination protein N)